MRRKPTAESDQPQWMISFADLLSLILTFFVLIYSMAQPMQMTNIYKWDYNSLVSLNTDINFSKINLEQGSDVMTNEYLLNIFTQRLKNENLDYLEIKTEHENFVISLSYDAINPEVLQKLAEILRSFNTNKHIFTADLARSYEIMGDLADLDVTEKIGAFEKDGIGDKVDIVIYP
ncbi:MAG: hypothetical protein COV36_03450 [Alphaproteobacteria bacterium CG11_big_fil_rev_8_21_14_0_20_44_7]|nr:MAG: hypothetical protein COV36_03450 [Alphaproteobacteria bacterium CG11_big_fil_rev_8_21_14_0_20_44_7]